MEGVGSSADFPTHAGRYKIEAENNLLSLAPRCLRLLVDQTYTTLPVNALLLVLMWYSFKPSSVDRNHPLLKHQHRCVFTLDIIPSSTNHSFI